MRTHYQGIFPGNGCHAAKVRAPGDVVHDLVHYPPDPEALMLLVDQATDKTLSVAEATQKKYPTIP